MTQGAMLSENCRVADSFFKRFLGLMGKKRMEPGSGLWIVPCNSIHMFFMRFPIDAVFLDKDLRVAEVIENLKPWQVSRLVGNACSVLELPAGTAKATGTRPGNRVEIMRG